MLRNDVVLRDGEYLGAAGGFVRDAELGRYIGDELAARVLECGEASGTHLLNDDLSTWPDASNLGAPQIISQ